MTFLNKKTLPKRLFSPINVVCYYNTSFTPFFHRSSWVWGCTIPSRSLTPTIPMATGIWGTSPLSSGNLQIYSCTHIWIPLDWKKRGFQMLVKHFVCVPILPLKDTHKICVHTYFVGIFQGQNRNTVSRRWVDLWRLITEILGEGIIHMLYNWESEHESPI